MRRALNFLASILVLGTILYVFRGIWLPPRPCTEPIPYALGDFDARFDISEKNFLDAVKEAEAVWEKPFGREFFVPAPENSSSLVPKVADLRTLQINLVYDHRQQATEKLEELGIAVENTRNSYDGLRTKFETLKASYERDAEAFEAAAGSFTERQKKYNDEVERWNKEGGVPPEEYERLENERAALETEAASLERRRTAVNRKADEVNALVVTLNRLARTLNLSVDTYNTVSLSRGETFEEGLYSETGGRKEINIYEFADRTELVRVLAHEFGHALSLGHVEDSEAIMYEYNEGTGTTAAEADMEALRAVCGAK